MTTIRFLQNRLFFEFVAQNQTQFNTESYDNFHDSFQIDQQVLRQFLQFAQSRDIDTDAADIAQDEDVIRKRLKSEIARNLWGTEQYHEIRINDDDQVKRAVAFFPQAQKMAYNME